MLDFGCATGRVIRHFAAYHPEAKVMGCDINALHVHWCNYFLPSNTVVFQNTSLPYLPLEDSSFDIVTAFSVFSHIEAFETSWIAEIARILKPGGVAYLTIHSERTFKNLHPQWPIYRVAKHKDFKPEWMGADMPCDKIIFRDSLERSYASNIFLREDYVRRVWGRFMTVEAINEYGYQDAVVLRK